MMHDLYRQRTKIVFLVLQFFLANSGLLSLGDILTPALTEKGVK